MKRWWLAGALATVVLAGTAFAQGGDVEARLKALEDEMKGVKQENRELKAEVDRLRPSGGGASSKDQEIRLQAMEEGIAAARGVQPMWKDGFRLRSEDGKYDIHFGGRLLVQSRTFIGETRRTDSFFVREARLQADGTLFNDYEFTVQGDFGRGSAQLQDGFLGWKRHKAFPLRLGQFKEPFGLEELTSGRFIDFIERSPGAVLYPGRDLGFMFHGKLWEDRIEYQLGAFNGNGRNNALDANDDKDIAARLVLTPFKPLDDPWLKGIRVGGAITYGSEKQAFGSLSDPNSAGTYITMTSGVRSRGDRKRLNVEGAWTKGPFKIQGEATWMDVQLARFVSGLPNGTIDDEGDFTSYYLEGLWVATGEDASDTFGRRKVAKNFLDGDGCGRIELGLRFSQFWTDDSLFDNGFASRSRSTPGYDSWTVGGNWWLNPYVRVSLNYFYNEFWQPFDVSGRIEDHESGILTRFQVDF